MKKHLAIRTGILLSGFLLIYIYDKWDSWFGSTQSIGGNSGMSIPMDFVLNVCWAALWCLFLLIEIIVSFFTGNRKYRGVNLILILSVLALTAIYIGNIK
ncbi:hypothetical protein JET18_03990 [Chryseobacterium sp. L7]|uniref:Uncharacterized protein n=1 Tax=Chryseobacterium endalhagicum TaxID=2797638 RepID=A0ABS1QD21_9FLAO|nr:hypothetical protein [Chryseobacterium endalhagicum]MBL1219984.1 hypothetical protein [Chryseobacterium endalhagicum]